MLLLVVEDSSTRPRDELADWVILPHQEQNSHMPTVRLLTSPSAPSIRKVLKLLQHGHLRSAALFGSVSPLGLDDPWWLFEFPRCMVVGNGLSEVDGLDLLEWRMVHQTDQFSVWKPESDPSLPEYPDMRLVASTDEFRLKLRSSERVAIRLDHPEYHLADKALFGDLAGQGGNTSALLSLSGAVPGSTSILLRNLAALELDELPADPDSFTELKESGALTMAAVGLSSYGTVGDLEAFLDPKAAAGVWRDTDTSRNQFWILAEFAARIDPPISIPPGHIFAQQQLNGIQTLATNTGIGFTLGIGQSRTVAIPAWCLNKNLAPPNRQPVVATRLRTRYDTRTSQEGVWADRQRIMGHP